MTRYLIVILCIIILFFNFCSTEESTNILVDTHDDWHNQTSVVKNTAIQKSNDLNGVIDLMGNGGLMLAKVDNQNRFNQTTSFVGVGEWSSKWVKAEVKTIEVEMVTYGNELDIRKGWQKFTEIGRAHV